MQDFQSMSVESTSTYRFFPAERSSRMQGLKCPRCDSNNTKFCYYNNYNLAQPRHFCKNCRRYWTKGGVLRNVPIGGGCRKSKRSKILTSEGDGEADGATKSSLFVAETPAAMDHHHLHDIHTDCGRSDVFSVMKNVDQVRDHVLLQEILPMAVVSPVSGIVDSTGPRTFDTCYPDVFEPELPPEEIKTGPSLTEFVDLAGSVGLTRNFGVMDWFVGGDQSLFDLTMIDGNRDCWNEGQWIQGEHAVN